MRRSLHAVVLTALALLVWLPAPVFAAEGYGDQYVVRSGDTLNQIAWSHGLSGWQSIVSANPGKIANPNLIYVGQILNLPGGGGASTPVRLAAPSNPVVSWAGGSPNHYPYGWCTWGAAHLARDNVDALGNAWHWIYGAMARGMPTGSVPRVGATVVFQPGVQGASSLGHVAHVVAVGAGGSFEVEGMAAPYWGVYSWSWVHTGWGVSFIY